MLLLSLPKICSAFTNSKSLTQTQSLQSSTSTPVRSSNSGAPAPPHVCSSSLNLSTIGFPQQIPGRPGIVGGSIWPTGDKPSGGWLLFTAYLGQGAVRPAGRGGFEGLSDVVCILLGAYCDPKFRTRCTGVVTIHESWRGWHGVDADLAEHPGHVFSLGMGSFGSPTQNF